MGLALTQASAALPRPGLAPEPHLRGHWCPVAWRLSEVWEGILSPGDMEKALGRLQGRGSVPSLNPVNSSWSCRARVASFIDLRGPWDPSVTAMHVPGRPGIEPLELLAFGAKRRIRSYLYL